MNEIGNGNEERSGDDYSQSDESASGLFKFYVGATLTLLTPTLFYCVVIDQLWPLWVMAGNEALGVVLGFVMFNMSSEGIPSCVPVTKVRKARRATHPRELKKAA